ncbi:MAG: ATP-binding protein [Clostridia bacterium]|nr:ATP-binding protein [Clostridia bacterium]
MSKLNELNTRLSVFSVLNGALKKSLFVKFEEYIKAEAQNEKLKKYGELVFDIYNNGASLTDYVRKIAFEDENAYVKAISKKAPVNQKIENAVFYELDTLSAFASLTSEDFKQDMGYDGFIPTFDSEIVDLKSEYKTRLKSIEKYGYGIFASNCMFSVSDSGEIIPVVTADTTRLEDFIGYKQERQRVIDNTVAFLNGKPAANILLYGDAGTGKSSTVKAVVNHLFDSGLRLVEIRKNQLLLLPRVMGEISQNPLKFIIFIDDLSFNQNDDSFSMLKATLEGSASARAKNAVIYATSNRRHIVKESFGEREGNDIHRNDTVQETLSLSERFGLTILFAKPEKKLYLEIVHELAERNGITMDKTELEIKAEAFALNRGYRSARCAEQFIDSLIK